MFAWKLLSVKCVALATRLNAQTVHDYNFMSIFSTFNRFAIEGINK